MQAIVATGTNFQLVFTPGVRGFSADPNRECDFDKEPGKVRSEKRALFFISRLYHAISRNQRLVGPFFYISRQTRTKTLGQCARLLSLFPFPLSAVY